MFDFIVLQCGKCLSLVVHQCDKMISLIVLSGA